MITLFNRIEEGEEPSNINRRFFFLRSAQLVGGLWLVSNVPQLSQPPPEALTALDLSVCGEILKRFYLPIVHQQLQSSSVLFEYMNRHAL